MKIRMLMTTAMVLSLALALIFPGLSMAQGLPPEDHHSSQDPGFVPNELIVLFNHGGDAPPPEKIVERTKARQLLPVDLGIATPAAARFVIPQRARGAARQKLDAAPDSPAALLQRYLVFTYPERTDLEAVEKALASNPHVRWVGKSRRAQLSFEPDDPLFPNEDGLGNPIPPDEHQWGLHILDLPAAWDRGKGHAYVGVIDTGIDTTHPDHQTFNPAGTYVGGNFRPFLSYDYGYDDNDVDEGQAQIEGGQLRTVDLAGHGTHVAGIVAANTDNGVGVAGSCPGCSLLISKISHLGFNNSLQAWVNTHIDEPDWVAGIHGAIDRGAQIITMSLGNRPIGSTPNPNCAANPLEPLCVAIDLAEERDLLIVAAAGNDGTSLPDWPASDERVIGVGGIAPDGSFWDDCPGFECGSNASPDQFVTPAKLVISTFYRGLPYVESIGCSDSFLPGYPGYGPCTGTSMAAPHMAGSAGLLRSLNPLLSQDDIEDILLGNLDNPPGWNPLNGYGKPDFAAAADDALGRVAGQVLTNRLTPLFDLYSPNAETHLSTSAPQMASAALLDGEAPYLTEFNVPLVPGYNRFPGTICTIGPCLNLPRAYVYLFTSDTPPFPNAPQLVPLYRMGFDEPFGGNPLDRSFFYTTEVAGLELGKGIGYEHVGIEGYIYPRCTPEPSCIPAGAVRLYRLYHFARDDYAIFPESQLAHFQSLGYVSQPSLNDWIGYVYENVDTDGDAVIDGFETLMGTKSSDVDSDGDGLEDGEEILDYPYSDPLDGPTCDVVFDDSFDGGNFGNWSSTAVVGNAQLAVSADAAMEGPFGMQVKVQGAGDRAFVRDQSPTSETVYRARFLFRFDAKMASGSLHRILAIQDASPASNVVLVRMQRGSATLANRAGFRLHALTRRDDQTWAVTPWINIQSQKKPIEIEVLWRASNAFLPNGSLDFTVDGQTVSLTGLDNDSFQVDRTYLGLVNGVDAGTEGVFHFDAFESCRD